MKKRYKLSEGFLDKFWDLFSNKKTPEKLQSIIDKDPVLLKLKKEMEQINQIGIDRLKVLKKTDPEIYDWIKKQGLAP